MRYLPDIVDVLRINVEWKIECYQHSSDVKYQPWEPSSTYYWQHPPTSFKTLAFSLFCIPSPLHLTSTFPHTNSYQSSSSLTFQQHLTQANNKILMYIFMSLGFCRTLCQWFISYLISSHGLSFSCYADDTWSTNSIPSSNPQCLAQLSTCLSGILSQIRNWNWIPANLN